MVIFLVLLSLLDSSGVHGMSSKSGGLDYTSVAIRSTSRNAISSTAEDYIILHHSCVTLANDINLESVIYFL